MENFIEQLKELNEKHYNEMNSIIDKYERRLRRRKDVYTLEELRIRQEAIKKNLSNLGYGE